MPASASNNPLKKPRKFDAWIRIAQHALNNSQWLEAEKALTQAEVLSPDDATLLQLQGQLRANLGQDQLALKLLRRSLSINPALANTHFTLSFVLKRLAKGDEAIAHIDKALQLLPDQTEYLFHKTTILQDIHRKEEALEILEKLLKSHPTISRYWNNAGNLHNSLGNPEQATKCFKQAMQLDPENHTAFSNYLTSLHYDPSQSRENIAQAYREWEEQHASTFTTRPETEKNPSRPLNVGMISDGFRVHPVGQMIIAALEKLPPHAYSFYIYSSNGKADNITQRFTKISEYSVTAHLNDEELAQKICADQIDILIDMAGYNSGSRMKVMAMQPAPLQVKWVGGLINTTGLNCIDYLISDSIESPIGDDKFYTEKLIRMPGDYICYEPPKYLPAINPLPALNNKFITLACFNNSRKLNPILIEQWAKIMNRLDNSRLFLKGSGYDHVTLRNKILKQFEGFGIDHSRIIFEGFSLHKELLTCYNHVDIALDPWPYSGGLTTCEAFAMGVPVVTMPGPTFAGRHSATHLVNAGMPELVTNSWDEYRERVIELAADLDSLSTIRSHLRTILQQSPVCDANTFAGHLDNALRAIWQRYTEGKKPAALSFTETGEVQFENDTAPMHLQHPEPPPEAKDETFKWEFEGKVIAIDHGAQLFDVPVVKQMLEQGTLELIAFDPTSNRLKHPVRQAQSIHYYPNILLGNRQSKTLYACQDSKLSGTLRPLQEEYFPKELQHGLSTLAELPITALSLDAVSELPSIDWLVLDHLNNSIDVLEQGTTALKDTLLIHADVAFQPTHEHQPNIAEVSHWAARHGFRFYCFVDEKKRTSVSQNIIGANNYCDELVRSKAIFIPSHRRMQTLSQSQLMKLAYIADSVYKLSGLSYTALSILDDGKDRVYIEHITKLSQDKRNNKTNMGDIKMHETIKKHAFNSVGSLNEDDTIGHQLENILKGLM